MHIFDHTLKPILLYNSEVWGSYNISSDRLNKTRVFDRDNIFKGLQCEKLHLKFSKFLLGVHKKSVNFTVLSESGRSPLHLNIVISLVKYWYRLVNLSNESKLLHDAYICSKNVANEGKQSWFLIYRKMLKFIGIQDTFRFFKFHKFKKTCKKLLHEIYVKNWYIRERPFNLKRKGVCFFLKKIS
jgi:hypothetical protein